MTWYSFKICCAEGCVTSIQAALRVDGGKNNSVTHHKHPQRYRVEAQNGAVFYIYIYKTARWSSHFLRIYCIPSPSISVETSLAWSTSRIKQFNFHLIGSELRKSLLSPLLPVCLHFPSPLSVSFCFPLSLIVFVCHCHVWFSFSPSLHLTVTLSLSASRAERKKINTAIHVSSLCPLFHISFLALLHSLCFCLPICFFLSYSDSAYLSLSLLCPPFFSWTS